MSNIKPFLYIIVKPISYSFPLFCFLSFTSRTKLPTIKISSMLSNILKKQNWIWVSGIIHWRQVLYLFEMCFNQISECLYLDNILITVWNCLQPEKPATSKQRKHKDKDELMKQPLGKWKPCVNFLFLLDMVLIYFRILNWQPYAIV